MELGPYLNRPLSVGWTSVAIVSRWQFSPEVGEAHDLQLLTELVEVDQLAHGGVEEAEAAGADDAIVDLDLFALAARRLGAHEVTRGLLG